MRFFSGLIACLAVVNSVSSLSLVQVLSSSYIVDVMSIDINTNSTIGIYTEYQNVSINANNVETLVNTQMSSLYPFNQTITYEVAQLTGTGSSAQDGPIYDFTASSWMPGNGNLGSNWTSCTYSTLGSRQPDYCTEIPEVPLQYHVCGRNLSMNCTLSQVACRHNDVILAPIFYMLDTKTGMIVQEMDTRNTTLINFWTNLIQNPTSGQFGNAVLLPAQSMCPGNNQHFPAVFGTQPIITLPTPTSAPTSSGGTTSTPTSSIPTIITSPTNPPLSSMSSSSSTGAYNPSSTGGRNTTFSAAPSTSSLSALVMLIPALLTAWMTRL